MTDADTIRLGASPSHDTVAVWSPHDMPGLVAYCCAEADRNRITRFYVYEVESGSEKQLVGFLPHDSRVMAPPHPQYREVAHYHNPGWTEVTEPVER